MTKRCCKCDETKPHEEFNVCRAASDGLQAMCRACSKAYQDVYKPRHRLRLRDAQRAYRRHPGVRERERAQHAEYRARLRTGGPGVAG